MRLIWPNDSVVLVRTIIRHQWQKCICFEPVHQEQILLLALQCTLQYIVFITWATTVRRWLIDWLKLPMVPIQRPRFFLRYCRPYFSISRRRGWPTTTPNERTVRDGRPLVTSRLATTHYNAVLYAMSCHAKLGMSLVVSQETTQWAIRPDRCYAIPPSIWPPAHRPSLPADRSAARPYFDNSRPTNRHPPTENKYTASRSRPAPRVIPLMRTRQIALPFPALASTGSNDRLIDGHKPDELTHEDRPTGRRVTEADDKSRRRRQR